MNQFLEIIELRTTGQKRKKLERTLEELLAEFHTTAENEDIHIYNGLAVRSDYCVHLHVPSDKTNSKGSPLGLRMVSILKEFGLVHHNIWCEMPFESLALNQENKDI